MSFEKIRNKYSKLLRVVPLNATKIIFEAGTGGLFSFFIEKINYSTFESDSSNIVITLPEDSTISYKGSSCKVGKICYYLPSDEFEIVT
jgi:hypothetical protein